MHGRKTSHCRKKGKPCITGVVVNGKEIRCGAVLSNANLKNTIERLLGLSKLPKKFARQAEEVRLNNTSCIKST